MHHIALILVSNTVASNKTQAMTQAEDILSSWFKDFAYCGYNELEFDECTVGLGYGSCPRWFSYWSSVVCGDSSESLKPHPRQLPAMRLNAAVLQRLEPMLSAYVNGTQGDIECPVFITAPDAPLPNSYSSSDFLGRYWVVPADLHY